MDGTIKKSLYGCNVDLRFQPRISALVVAVLLGAIVNITANTGAAEEGAAAAGRGDVLPEPASSAPGTDECGPAYRVPPGIDCWHTPPVTDPSRPESASASFDFSRHPVPAGFFGPHSVPFDEVVAFGARPGTEIDTRVERLDTMCLGMGTTAMAETAIRLHTLELVGRIEVTFECESGPQPWPPTCPADTWTKAYEVVASVSDYEPAAVGYLRATKTHSNGGTFDALLPVQVKFTFRRFATMPPQDLVFDAGAQYAPAWFAVDGVPWVHEAPFSPCAGGAADRALPRFIPGVIGAGVRSSNVARGSTYAVCCHCTPDGLKVHCPRTAGVDVGGHGIEQYWDCPDGCEPLFQHTWPVDPE